MTSNFLNPVTTQTWSNGRHVVRCVKVIQETWDVRTFCFMAEQPLMFFFKPGQFVTLELQVDGQQVMRSYTIASSPAVPYSFSITVKRVAGGLLSNWLHDNMALGHTLAVHGPVGAFNAIDFPADKVLLLSGGVGITPLMSMARWFCDTNAGVDMVFVHSARSPRDIIFQRELENMAARLDNFALHLICEKHGFGEAWTGYRGYLSAPMLELIAADFREREIFCCGPAPYMRAVRQLLESRGYDMQHYHEEAFGPTPTEVRTEAREQAAEAADAEPAARQFEVAFQASGKSVRIAPGETVHAAAAKLGLHIPKACGMGICGTCRVLKSSGEVEMEHNGGITEEDEAEGYILSCCCVPKSDLVIDF
ncbi:hybrid-cluster NAD(P)-dependent oxidoreductase [Stutzerimonas kirkiae]|uniref:Hybrid-cluster NAD(P)-dependent oxidoreductase n=1 Tax=Stutzerimonas kirkiae TaxID=2211392 RepID=A0A4Q9RE70_9GAMM|nr:hybrid-cluster NAD(P)-dependent oxidoreductase [Stutzerimonas kirkiae]TBU99880.1 hybrid-cluster NAD(P)-dependent oxidoreductase [Stutzerimonas kirkiae]TBV05189.1 hybrid-cluster NAD(P)-dependent oxidoreductase [Stutzerimonas kirkiae]TBV08092.1 hybrid-cluster NAD(P)-dependent oxidoreductase [Stutzerimonas kirkiae]TBV17548.1 hybrid-cluster NAD(P)-dependent oxidoreductase [Stutzerimonas kirkiae]